MIPQFPEFKNIEFSDKHEIEEFTNRFPPYSDFNFASMFSWDIKEEMQISWLNENLVVRFTDYISSKPFYSFIGVNKKYETIDVLLKFIKSKGEIQELRLVPEISILDMDNRDFLILEDRDHFDYIIPTKIFSEYDTNKTRDRRNSVKKFLNDFSPKNLQIDISNKSVKEEIYELFKKWSYDSIDPLEVQNELLALRRFLENDFHNRHVCTGVYINNILVGFCLTENHGNGYSTIHFCKADKKISQGLYSYMLQINAKSLIEGGHELLNLEQDLGISNIRRWKMSHGVHIFLKKYVIRYNNLI